MAHSILITLIELFVALRQVTDFFLTHGSIGYYGNPCQVLCTKANVTFTFSNNRLFHTSTMAFQGQIPRLYFRA